jgi:hypothetical protein
MKTKINKSLTLLLSILIPFGCAAGEPEIPELETERIPELANETNSVQVNFTELEQRLNEVSVPQNVKEVPVLWSIDTDIIDGSVFDLAITGNQLYVFGTLFDVSEIPDMYERYKAGEGESIHYYLEDPFNPIYYHPNNAYITTFSFDGVEINQTILDYADEEDFRNVFYLMGELAFQLITAPKGENYEVFETIGIINDGDIRFLIEDSTEYGFLTFVDNLVLDYHFDSDSMERYTNLFTLSDDTFQLISTFDAPSTDVGYRIDDKVFGYSVFFDQNIYDLDNYTVVKNKLEFENPIIRQTEQLAFEHIDGINYGLSYIGYDDDFDGFLWFVTPHGEEPQYRYFLSDSIEFTNMYVADDGIYITGQEDGKMLLVFMDLGGEIQWKAHFRDGILRGFAEQDGRYFIAGDYNVQASTKPKDIGIDYQFLAEIQID